MPTISVPGLGDIDFPEGTAPAVMEGAIKRSLAERAPSITAGIQATGESVLKGREALNQPPPEGKVQAAQDRLATGRITRQGPRPMGAVSSLDVKTGKILPPTPESASGSYGPALAVLAPGGAMVSGAIQGLGSMIEGLAKGKSVQEAAPEAAVSAALPGAGKAVGAVVKSGVRTLSNIWSRGVMEKVVDSAYEAAKKLPDAVSKYDATIKAGQAIEAGAGRTSHPEALKAVQQFGKDIADAAQAKNPLKYGEVLQRVIQMNEKARSLWESGQKEAARQIRGVTDAALQDLDKVNPAAKEAAEMYRTLKGRMPELIEKVKPYIAASGVGSMLWHPAASVPAVVGSAIIGSLVRLGEPGKMMAKSLLQPSKASGQTLSVLGQIVKSNLQEGQNGNNPIQ